MTARKIVMSDRYTPNLTKEILKLTEKHDTNSSIMALKIALSVLKIEMEDHRQLELYPNSLIC